VTAWFEVDTGVTDGEGDADELEDLLLVDGLKS